MEMDILHNDINLTLYYYVKREDALLAPVTNNDDDRAAISGKEANKKRTKQFRKRLKRLFSTYTKLTAADSRFCTLVIRNGYLIRVLCGGGGSELSSADNLDPITNQRRGTKQIPHFLRSVFRNKQREVSPNAEVTDTSVDQSEESVESVPDCDCDNRRITLMADSMIFLISKNKNNDLRCQIMRELQQIDQKTLHVKTCPAARLSEFARVQCYHGDSNISEPILRSFYSDLLCREPDEQNEGDVGTLLPLLERLENEDDLNIPQKTIEYFLQASCYEHFKAGLIKVIGSECTPKNVAKLFYLVRRIIQHFEDPTDEKDKRMDNILNYTQRFNLCYYQPYIISNYKSMINFILSGLTNNEVD